MAVELLLPLGEHAATDILSTEVAGQRIHDDELHVHAAAEALDLVHQENLVSRIVRAGHVDAAEDRVRVEAQSSRHLRDALWAEGVLGVDVEDVAVEAAFGHGERAVHGQLVADLRLPGAECTVHFDQGLGFEAAAEQVVDRLDLGGELEHLTAAVEQGSTGDEAADVGHLLGAGDDLACDRLAKFRLLCKLGRRHHGDGQELIEAGLAQLFCGRRPDPREVFDADRNLGFLRHQEVIFLGGAFILRLACCALGFGRHGFTFLGQRDGRPPMKDLWTPTRTSKVLLPREGSDVPRWFTFSSDFVHFRLFGGEGASGALCLGVKHIDDARHGDLLVVRIQGDA